MARRSTRAMEQVDQQGDQLTEARLLQSLTGCSATVVEALCGKISLDGPMSPYQSPPGRSRNLPSTRVLAMETIDVSSAVVCQCPVTKTRFVGVAAVNQHPLRPDYYLSPYTLHPTFAAPEDSDVETYQATAEDATLVEVDDYLGQRMLGLRECTRTRVTEYIAALFPSRRNVVSVHTCNVVDAPASLELANNSSVTSNAATAGVGTLSFTLFVAVHLVAETGAEPSTWTALHCIGASVSPVGNQYVLSSKVRLDLIDAPSLNKGPEKEVGCTVSYCDRQPRKETVHETGSRDGVLNSMPPSLASDAAGLTAASITSNDHVACTIFDMIQSVESTTLLPSMFNVEIPRCFTSVCHHIRRFHAAPLLDEEEGEEFSLKTMRSTTTSLTDSFSKATMMGHVAKELATLASRKSKAAVGASPRR